MRKRGEGECFKQELFVISALGSGPQRLETSGAWYGTQNIRLRFLSLSTSGKKRRGRGKRRGARLIGGGGCGAVETNGGVGLMARG